MNTETMSDDQYQALAEKLEATARNVPKVLKVLWIVLVGAFAIGSWVAVVDFRQKRTENDIQEIRTSAINADDRLRSIESRSATSEAKIDSIKETVSRIDRKMDNP